MKRSVLCSVLLPTVLAVAICFSGCSKDKDKDKSKASPSESPSSSPSAEPLNMPTPSPSPTPEYRSVMVGTVKGVKSFLNVRNGPGTSYESVGKASTGDTFIVQRRNVDGTDWHRIEYGDGYAFVHSDYLDVTTEMVVVEE